MEDVNRREFLITSALFTSAACRSSDAMTQVNPPPSYSLPDQARIVFQGDSVTDGNRSNATTNPNIAEAMGHGYPLFIAQHLLFSRPKQKLQLFNRARGGDTVPLMQARWQADTIDFQPDLLSILIGLNDFVADYGTPDYATKYEQGYKALIDQTRQALPNTKFVIVEPYAITDQQVPEFQNIRDAAKRVATYANAIFVPIHDMLNKHVQEDGHDYWFSDQHPTIAGSAAIADQWLKTVGL